MLLNENIEYLIHCDEEGNNIGPISREHAHIPTVRKELCHKVVSAMVYCKNTNKWCIQQKFSKAIKKKIWDISVGGHCTYEKKGNDYEALDFNETLIKESYEELGLSITINKNLENNSNTGHIFRTCLYKNSYNNEFLGLGLIITGDEKITPIDGEVLSFKWLTLDELKKFMDEEFCSDSLKTFFPLFEKLLNSF